MRQVMPQELKWNLDKGYRYTSPFKVGIKLLNVPITCENVPMTKPCVSTDKSNDPALFTCEFTGVTGITATVGPQHAYTVQVKTTFGQDLGEVARLDCSLPPEESSFMQAAAYTGTGSAALNVTVLYAGQALPFQGLPGGNVITLTGMALPPQMPPPSPPPVPPHPPSPPPSPPATIIVYAYDEGKVAKTSPSATATAKVQPGITYAVKVELLRNDLAGSDEYATSIKLGDKGSTLTHLGSCNPDGGDYDCTFFHCSDLSTTWKPTTDTAEFRIDLTGHSWDCDCDMSDTSPWTCAAQETVSTYTPVTAVARFTLVPA